MKRENLLTKGALFAVAVLMMAMCAPQAQAALYVTPENMYDISTVHSLYIVVSAADYEAMRFSTDTEMGNVYPEEVEPGVWVHTYWQAYMADNATMTDAIAVAVRRKSDLALPSELDPQKFSLKVDISRPGFTPAGQRFGGKKKFSLECGSDSSIVSEGLSWNIYNDAGVISGRSNWVKVYISTTGGSSWMYKGLYANVEQPDEEYLEDHMPGRHDYGFLYKITEYNGEVKKTREDCTDPVISCVNPFEFSWYPFDHPQYIDEEVPPPADWLTQIPERVDMDQMMKFAAVESFIANADGTMNKGNNYFYYDWATGPDPNIMDPAYKEGRVYLPWDLDTTMKSSDFDMELLQIEGGNFKQGLILEQDESGTPYGYETYKSSYYDTYYSLLNGPLTKPNLLTMITNIETAIATELDADPYAEVTSTEEFARLRDFVQDRWDYTEGQLSAMLPLPGTSLLDDGFEDATWDTNWNDAAHSWLESTSVVNGGASSAWAKSGNEGNFTSDSLDTSDATAVHVRFAIQKDDIESGEFDLYYYNGTSYNLIADLDALGGDDVWLMYSDTITDSQYFVSNFQIRFNANPSDSKENVWVDDVEITKEVPILVPDVVDVAQATAEANIIAASLTVGTVTTACDNGIAAGNVISQNPASGTAAAAGAAVDIVVSTGPCSVTVPDVVGLAQVTAEGDITGAGLAVGVVTTAYSDTVLAGDVISQNPVGGSSALPGSSVDLVVSLGVQMVTVPDVVGLAQATAEGNITAAILTVGAVTTEYSDTVAAGDVISQSLTAGASVVHDTAVDLVVSDGPRDRIISGYVLEPDDVTPIENVNIEIIDGGIADVTDAAGYYEFSVEYGWSGVVDPNAVGYTFDPNDLTYDNVVADMADQNFTGILDGFIISGYILEDDAVTPIEGVTVTPDNGGGYFTDKYDVGADSTDAAGYYEVLVDHDFSGDVTPTHNAYTFAPISTSYANVVSDVAGQDYAGTMLTFSISGYVEDVLAAPVEGVIVMAQGGGGTDVTDATGYYEVFVDYGWTNSLTAMKTDYTFTAPAAFDNVTSSYVDEDFVAQRDADISGDGFVDVADLVILCQNWLTAGSLAEGNLDESGLIDLQDVAELAEYWQP